MFRSVVLAVSLLLCLNLNAQVMPFKNYGIKDGLNDNNVQAVIRDDRGLLWVGTDFGIYWFDGKKFFQPKVKATVGQLYVSGFYKDRKGVIWVLTFFNGLYKYQNGHFTNYLVDNLQKDATINTISDIVQVSDDKYLVISQNLPYLFDGHAFTTFDASNPFLKTKTNSITQLADKSIVLGTDNGFFVYRYDKSKVTLLGHFLPGTITNKVLVSKGFVSVLTDRGVFSYPLAGPNPFSAAPTGYLRNSRLKDMATDRDGALWVIADNGSFWTLADTVFKINNGKITAYAKRNGLPENIEQIYCDDEGLVWFANRKGISLLGDEYYEFNRISSGRYNDPVTALVSDESNNLWAGTISGLVEKKDNRYLFYQNCGKDSIGTVSWLVKTSDGYCLAGTTVGILKITNNSLKKYLDIHSTAMSMDNNRILWLGGVNGEVWKYDGSSLTSIKLSSSISEMITAMAVDKNALWIGYRDRGIVKYQIKKDSLQQVSEYSAKTGYPDMRIRCSTRDEKGNIIWGTRTNGVFVFSAGTGKVIAHINTQNGLNANWVKDLSAGNDGKLYLATNHGVNIISGDYSKPVVRLIRIDDDNINRETNCIVKNGDVFYVGTNEGVLTWMPANIRKDTVPPRVYFTKINIQGLKNFAIDPYARNAGEITLPYDQHFISFEFSGVSLKDPQNVMYHYILTGQDNDWGPLTEHNDVAFDLKPGNYTFKVAAKNGDGLWSRQPAIFHFIIKPPFWQTWWFIILVAAVIVFASYSAYRYKLSKMLALELLRNKISTDLHDDIGSTLSSISILSEVASGEKEPKAKRMLAEINERSHLLMEKMDDIVWSISTSNDTVGNLFVRIQQFASGVLEARDVDYEVHVPDNIKEIKLDMQRRQHIYLILKEAINNLIKYSCCTTVCITVEYAGGSLTVIVTDDGKGFDLKNVVLGNGLNNMKKRAADMRGKLFIASAPGKGSSVTLSVQIE
jgi:signal transduction histidine kinase/ligand-binding sensor domain-containing protein